MIIYPSFHLKRIVLSTNALLHNENMRFKTLIIKPEIS